MRIAILGASSTGKTRLALDLAQHLPDQTVTDDPPLAAVQTHCFDRVLLTGLDLPGCHAECHQQADARLRAALQEAGMAYGVVYGSGPQRLHNALRLIRPQEIAPRTGWNWVCDKCSDPDCEFRLFTGLRDSRAAVHPSP